MRFQVIKQRKSKGTERDKIAVEAKIVMRLLLWEAAGGIIPLAKGLESYKPPQIAYSERLDAVKVASGLMLTDLKVDPDEEVSGFDLLRSEYGSKRDSRENSDRGVSSSADSSESANQPAASESADTPDAAEG
jgi:hypothetical protein